MRAPALRVIGQVSGGVGSFSAVRREVDRNGSENLSLLFTDTLIEDQDAYRFLIASAANLFGVRLGDNSLPRIDQFPAWQDRDAYKRFVMQLREDVSEILPNLVWIADGRDPWDVYEDERFLGNSRLDPCSKVLKREIADKWLTSTCIPTETRIIVGIDYEEIERYQGDGRGSRGIKARMAEKGWTVEAPLCEAPYLSWMDRRRRLNEEKLWLPRLNKLGFAHNNCGGHCCKGGIGHWKLLLEHFPERYIYCMDREQSVRELLNNDVAMLTDRRKGDKVPLPLTVLKDRKLTEDELSEMGGCNCFFDFAA